MKNYLLLLIIAVSACNQNQSINNSQANVTLYKGEFGTCCTELGDALNKRKVPNSFFVISPGNILYQTIGYVDTGEGPGYFDQAVIFCPFCGKKLQDKIKIKAKSKSTI